MTIIERKIFLHQGIMYTDELGKIIPYSIYYQGNNQPLLKKKQGKRNIIYLKELFKNFKMGRKIWEASISLSIKPDSMSPKHTTSWVVVLQTRITGKEENRLHTYCNDFLCNSLCFFTYPSPPLTTPPPPPLPRPPSLRRHLSPHPLPTLPISTPLCHGQFCTAPTTVMIPMLPAAVPTPGINTLSYE